MTGEFGNVADYCPDPIIVYDQNTVVQYANPAFERFFGWESKQVIGKQVPYFPESCSGHPVEMLKAFASGKSNLTIETTRITKAGEQRHVRLSANPLKDQNNDIKGMVVAFQDISELVVNRQEALEANRIKQDFLANISHEIRTPMNGLMGMVDLLEQTDLDDEQVELVSILKNRSETLMVTLQKLLDFSAIDAGKVESIRIDFDIRNMMDQIRDAFVAPAAAKELDIEFQVQENVPSRLKGDPEKLRQVMAHLLDNAVKFTDHGKIKIVVSLKSEDQQKARLEFKVKDTGVGIPEDKLNTIFSAFSQADTTATRRYDGLGLGLNISNQLLKLMQAAISVESRMSGGTCFSFVIEFEKQQSLIQGPIDFTKGVRHKRILIVDDDDASRSILKGFLIKWGADFEEAVNGERAFEKLQNAFSQGRGFEIILVGMHATAMDGEALCRRIKGSETFQDVRLIALSSVGKRGDAARLESIGVKGYLPVPVNASYLFECIIYVTSEKFGSSGPLVTRHLMDECRRRQFHVVLFEPGMAGRTIICNVLKKSGYPVTVISNRDDVEKEVKDNPYLLAIIDCQGEESCRIMEHLAQVKKERKQKQDGWLVIIAMVEHSQDEQSASDDFLIKPVTRNGLHSLLERWSQKIRRAHERMNPGKSEKQVRSGSKIVFNFSAALERAMDDKAFLKMLVEKFVTDLSEKIENIQKGLESGDCAVLSSKAHSLRGSALSIGAEAISIVALDLENHFDQGDLIAAKEKLRLLELEYQSFSEHVNQMDWGGI